MSAKHPMPALTQQQREEFIADCEHAIANENNEYSPEDVLKHHILLASLTAEPEVYMNSMLSLVSKQAGEELLEKGYHAKPYYTASPVPALNPVKLMKAPSVRESAHETHQAYAEGVIAGLDSARDSIRAAGYEVAP